MSKLAGKATVRKRNQDKTASRYMLGMVCVCIFSMCFIVFSLNKDKDIMVSFLDNSGTVHSAQVMPFGDAKEYHEYLKDMAVNGIYARDEEGALNQFLEKIGSPEVINKRNGRIKDTEDLFREKHMIQMPRVLAYKVDVISNVRTDIYVKLQVIRESFSLGGDEVEGIQTKVLTCTFEHNENMSDGFYKPWILTSFKDEDFVEK